MKKILFLSLVSVVAVATAAPYNAQLLKDGSFEEWDFDNPEWVYYWNVNAGVHSQGTEDKAFQGSRSLEIRSNSTWQEDGVSLNTGRNVINEGLSYNAGDTVEMSMMVNVTGWDPTGPGTGLGFRLVTNPVDSGVSVAYVSDFVKETDGNWQEITGEYTFAEAFEGELNFQIRFNHSENDNSAVEDYAYVDGASMQVVPEPATLSLLGIGSCLLYRKRKK
ncbi:PEP-CTERM sorting domain-containing protein [Sedimentisphaera salicampi]|uniref:Uncharacterized protein n=1 Tax=Sedimentisphaera salicampi TaxID=1941349 RepID=A0A1W6LLQ2_9BACT|nr:PEP-CTERM sorting domain-containing protein [Sedimentisphaera salicampi]ARN56682.1 hypothetical protein STSP1_01071 [Sedimentisphaera salicampi]OXU15121.1 hypothetical protein SMSP1_01051 [Sedimentisphaera salicampi]